MLGSRRSFFCASLGSVLATPALLSCHLSRPSLPHDFYVWQQAWLPSVDRALRLAGSDVRAWRVLGLHVGGSPRLTVPDIHAAALVATGRPVVLVVRVEGSGARLDDAALLPRLAAVLGAWRAAGVPVAGMEVDFDCAVSRLPAYVQWLRGLRSWPALSGLPLSITLLPAWLASLDLPALLAVVDDAVLQVHAVRRPAAGLFDAASARRWVSALAALTSRAFRVALPCYATRVSYDEWGEVVATESEAWALLRSSHEQELTASPREVAALLGWLQREGPRQVQGVVWFRLPTDADQRSWRLATWQAVVRGLPLPAAPGVRLQPAGDAGLLDVVLSNPGTVDVDLPASVRLPPACHSADARQGYAMDLLRSPARLVRRQAGWLRPGQQVVIGWMRCDSKLEIRDVQTQIQVQVAAP